MDKFYGIPRRDGLWVRIGRWWYHPVYGRVPLIAGGTNTFGVTQRAFRFYEDGTEADSPAIAAQDTNITLHVLTNRRCLLRIGLQESGSGSASGATTDDYQLQVSQNGGAYANVSGASADVLAYDSSTLTNNNATTQRLTAGTGSFIAGEISEDGLVDDFQLTANNHTELLFTIQVTAADVAAADTLDFRVLLNGGTFTYSVTPRITVTKTLINAALQQFPDTAQAHKRNEVVPY